MSFGFLLKNFVFFLRVPRVLHRKIPLSIWGSYSILISGRFSSRVEVICDYFWFFFSLKIPNTQISKSYILQARSCSFQGFLFITKAKIDLQAKCDSQSEDLVLNSFLLPILPGLHGPLLCHSPKSY